MKSLSTFSGAILIAVVSSANGYGFFDKDGINITGVIINVAATVFLSSVISLISKK